MNLRELAAALGAELVLPAEAGDTAAIRIDGVAAPRQATGAQLVFAENEAAFRAAIESAAGALLASFRLRPTDPGKPLLLVEQPKLAFARAARLLNKPHAPRGIHDHATVDPSTIVCKGVSVHAGAVVERHVTIGANTRIDGGVIIGEGVVIGEDCHLYPRVVIYSGTELGNRVIVHAGAVLGSDGFGYVRDSVSRAYTQFPQQGRLVIEDDVEIGANATIDRGALEETRIGRGAKLDNLVHVGHNVSIGRDVVIAAQTGISGSSTIGDGAVVGGQVGIADHVTIGPGAILGAQAGIPSGKRIQGPGTVFWGTPARPIREYLKELATLALLTRRSR